jgi:hypothetical protein
VGTVTTAPSVRPPYTVWAGPGGSLSANLFAAQGTLTWLSGAEQVRVFNLPGARHSKAFCATCGSALPRGTQPGGLVVVPAGSLDSPVEIRPEGHIFMGSRADWDHDLDTLPQADTYLR